MSEPKKHNPDMLKQIQLSQCNCRYHQEMNWKNGYDPWCPRFRFKFLQWSMCWYRDNVAPQKSYMAWLPDQLRECTLQIDMPLMTLQEYTDVANTGETKAKRYMNPQD